MEQRFGKRVIQKAVEESFSRDWLEENCKSCPRCGTNIQVVLLFSSFFVQTLVISHLFFVNALHINQCFPMWGAMPLIGHSYCWVVFTYSEKNASFVISFFFVCWPVVYLVHDFVSVSKTQVYELTFVFYLMFSSRKWTAATRWLVPHASNISVGCAWALSAKSTHMVTLMIHAPPVTTSEWNIST